MAYGQLIMLLEFTVAIVIVVVAAAVVVFADPLRMELPSLLVWEVISKTLLIICLLISWLSLLTGIGLSGWRRLVQVLIVL
ncbi:MAG: hypothetical protein AAF572_01535 [Cyanobacteria bacterium P01_B01_bin.77]